MNEPLAARDRAQTIVAYLKNEMTDEEKQAFEERMFEEDVLQAEVERTKEVLDALAASTSVGIVRGVNALIGYAIDRGGSDLHLVPARGGTFKIYLRIDGVLHPIVRESLPENPLFTNAPEAVFQPTVDRIKTMAEMDLAVRMPQSGRMPLRYQGKSYNLRVSVQPALYGEHVTLRIVAQDDIHIGLDRLNFSRERRSALGRISQGKGGLVLIGGPAGSGRSTLVYSLLEEIRNLAPHPLNIMTIEDPVELALSSDTMPITQTAVETTLGLTMAAGLRTLLRSDPDVVYCSRIVDRATAELATESAKLGPLVLSCLIVPDALSLIEYLRHLGIPDYVIADSLTALISIRLLRRIDPSQTETYLPEPGDLERIRLTEKDGPFRRGVPTPENGNTGYSGKIPIAEIIEMTPELRRAIAIGAPLNELSSIAFSKGGMLADDARQRIREGGTTVEEVLRVLP